MHVKEDSPKRKATGGDGMTTATAPARERANKKGGAEKPIHVVFVPHTHWDREWYYPLDVFRRRLAELMNKLLEILEKNPAYRTFVLDGQVAMLEDYLEWHPEKEKAVRKLIAKKRLRLGPWYTQPDEFIPCGESIIRNLLMGKKRASTFGDWMAVGYCPDSFGHVGQLPQILRGFGLDHAFFTRGMGDEPRSTEYRWSSPDGSEVIATCLLHAYSIAGLLPENMDEAIERVRCETGRLEPWLATPYALLNQGGDHHVPQEILPDLVRRLKERKIYKSCTVGDFESYSRLVKDALPGALPSISGALRGSRNYPILCGILSAHRRLKLFNEQCESMLLRKAEPLAALAGVCSDFDIEVPLHHAWRTLLQNHAHDTIGACSVDEVTREARTRFEKVLKLAEALGKDSAHRFIESLALAPPQDGLPPRERGAQDTHRRSPRRDGIETPPLGERLDRSAHGCSTRVVLRESFGKGPRARRAVPGNQGGGSKKKRRGDGSGPYASSLGGLALPGRHQIPQGGGRAEDPHPRCSGAGLPHLPPFSLASRAFRVAKGRSRRTIPSGPAGGGILSSP
jgi:hypothetical protein